MASKTRILAIICGCLMVITCVLYITSNVLPEWGHDATGLMESNFGLWKTCKPNIWPLPPICADVPFKCNLPLISTACKKIPVAKAFVTAACIISGLCALALFVCGTIRGDSNRGILLLTKTFLLLSFIAGLIGVALGLAFVTDTASGYKIAVSAIIGIIAVIINGVATLMAMLMT